VGVQPIPKPFFRDKAKTLLWSKTISTKKATRLAAELMQASATMPESQPKTWIQDTFNPLKLQATTMAFHVLNYTAKSKVSSPVENCFNHWKKFMKSRLKRALLNETFAHVMNSIEKRIIADANHLKICIAKGHFIDMRKDVILYIDRKKHKKRRSTLTVFEKENAKTQDKECCIWSEAISLGDKLWLMLERVHKYKRDKVQDCTIVHVVSMKGFLWRDCTENVPPTCLTCPVFLNTKCPCIGIQRALQNVAPDVGDMNLSQWLSGRGVFRPEIFNNRLRIDKDPTMHLPDYMQCAPPKVAVTSSQSTSPSQAVVTEADNMATLKDLTSRIKQLPVTVQPKAHALFAQDLLQFTRRLQRFELDVHVAVTLQGRAQKSSIAHLHAGGAKDGKVRASKLAPASRRTSVGKRNDELDDAQIAVTDAATSATSASSRKPAGTSKGVPIEDQWKCEYCNRGVKNTASSVKQHCTGEQHVQNVAEWPVGKALKPFQCSVCSAEMVNDAKILRDHRKKCAASSAASAAPRIWHCNACDTDMPADPITVNVHNDSLAHQRQVRLAAEAPHYRDGPALARQTREENAAARDGNAKRRRQKK
jgi:hypothetical protein